jgi:hypothetical protein
MVIGWGDVITPYRASRGSLTVTSTVTYVYGIDASPQVTQPGGCVTEVSPNLYGATLL